MSWSNDPEMRAAWRRQYAEAHRQQGLDRKRVWYVAHREQILARRYESHRVFADEFNKPISPLRQPAPWLDQRWFKEANARQGDL